MLSQSLLAAFSANAADPRFLFSAGVAVVAGLVRGFAGFGSALIYMPLVSAVYGPQIAAPTLLLFDTACSLPFAVHAFPHCNRREVAWVAVAGAIFIPIGVMALLWIDAIILRWFIAVLVLFALGVLVAGWRYRGRPTVAAALATGAVSGFGGGSVQIGAPPLLVFWLGGENNAATVRANIMVYFILQGALSIILYLSTGLFSAQVFALAIMLGVPFMLAMAAGTYWFHGSSDGLYRRVAYVIIAFAGLASLPIFDSLR